MGKQNRKLLENIKRYEEEKANQQESKVYGQKLVKETKNKEKSTHVWAKRCEGICSMVWKLIRGEGGLTAG